MNLEEATALAQKQANEFGVVMIVVKDDLSEDSGGYECCAEMYRTIAVSRSTQSFLGDREAIHLLLLLL